MNRLFAVLLTCWTTLALAEELPKNIVGFDVQASREVANDTAHATLFVEITDVEPTRLSERVNQGLASAIRLVRKTPAIHSLSTAYSTYPIYNKQNKLDGWRARGELRLVSRDFDTLANLIGELQKMQPSTPLQLGGIHYSVSDEMRRKIENELIEEGLRSYRERAALVQRSMGSKGWRLVNLTVNSQSAQPPILYRASRLAEQSITGSPAPVEGGESRLTVNIQGRIELE